ncbi:MAG: hypothetical protein ABFR82_14310 [Nitrospirota bacterium]
MKVGVICKSFKMHLLSESFKSHHHLQIINFPPHSDLGGVKKLRLEGDRNSSSKDCQFGPP